MQEYTKEVKEKTIVVRRKYLNSEVWESNNSEDIEPDRYFNGRK